MIGVHESNALSFSNERESCLIAGDALIGEVLEDLLESRLLYTILLDAQIFPLKLELAEEPADGLAFLGHSHLEKLAALFKDLNLLEVPCQVCQDAEAVRLGLQVLDEVAEAHLSVVVQLCFCYQIVTNTVNRNLLEYEPIKVRTSALIDRSLEVDLGRQIVSRASEAKLVCHLLEIAVVGLDHFDLDLVSDAVLVLDMLCAAHTTEHAAANHYAKLSRKSLGLLHRVRCEDDCRPLIALTDLLHDLPHEAARFRVHTCRRLV